MPSEYRLRRRVQFHETDAAGIVHFSWFYRYMEEAEHALWRQAGLSIHSPGVSSRRRSGRPSALLSAGSVIDLPLFSRIVLVC